MVQSAYEQCPKRCTRARGNLNSTQSNSEVFDGLNQGFGGVVCDKNLVSSLPGLSVAGLIWYRGLSTSPVACKQPGADGVAHLGQPGGQQGFGRFF